MTSPATTLVLLIVQPDDAVALLAALTDAGCGATYLTARGGFLRRRAVAILVLTPVERIPVVLAAARATCSRRTAFFTALVDPELGGTSEPVEIEVGGAVIFGLPVTLAAHWGTVVTAAPTFPNTSLLWPAPVVGGHAPPQPEPPPADTAPTRLIVAVVPDQAAARVVGALVERRFGATTISSTGGFLRRGTTTILSAVPAGQAGEAAAVIQTAARPPGAASADHGGVAFALDVAWRLRL